MLADQQVRKLYSLTEHMNYATMMDHDTPRSKSFTRSKGILLIAVVLTIAVIGRLIYLNTLSNNFLAKQLSVRVEREIKIPAMRGVIVDRNNNPLAVSTPVASIWIDPSDMDELTQEQKRNLSDILQMSIPELDAKLSQKNKTFVYLKRAVSPVQADMINKLGLDGVYSIQEFKRFYPSAEVTAHVVGFNNIDDRGAEGVEYANDKQLVGYDGEEQVLRDRQGHVIENTGVEDAVNGHTITLSIDDRIQYLAYNALKNQVDKYHAKGGSVVVLDAKTGEVLSMVNMPTYNPNNRQKATLDMLRNRAAIDIYEPGSTMKPLLVAKAIDEGIVTPNTVFDTLPYHIGSKLIRDTHDHPQLTVSQIIEKSSDVGVSKIAFKMQPEDLWSYDHVLGFGQKVGTNFPGEAKGVLRPWQKWGKLDVASMSYGYAISVSLMQMARAYTMFTNNGCMLPLTFYKIAGAKPQCTQIIKNRTAEEMQTMLASVVSDDGATGKLAQVDGYTAAGKTGTAHKSMGRGGYAKNSYVGSFVGYAPAKDPRLVIAVMIDDPHGQYFGGQVAAPVFSEIAGSSLRLLGVKPDRL